ncbi:hypothetical protein HanRHA438_Chr11g0488361 [Helianthus annuus]|nr:hypothetical protein HanRHA438_Chr11g0488361 [Helianthus annuus]
MLGGKCSLKRSVANRVNKKPWVRGLFVNQEFKQKINEMIWSSRTIRLGYHCFASRLTSREDGPIGTNWNWRTGPGSFLEISEINWLMRDLGSVKLEGREDKWKWIGAGTEDYSVGAVRRTVSKSVDHSGNFVMKWCKWVPIKCNVFAWRAEMGKIPTGTTLRERNIEIDDVPVLFVGREMSRVTISSLLVWWRAGSGITFRDGVEWRLLRLTLLERC